MRTAVVFAILVLGVGAGLSRAEDKLPAPVPEPAAESSEWILRPWGRVNRYAVWQNYGVDLQGRFRPRVLYTSEGAYYYFNGQPYPWLSSHPLSFMPYAND